MSGALLSEVWPDMVQKPKKMKKKKKKEDYVAIAPLTPQEMETELLDDRQNPEQDPSRKLSGMNVSPYTDGEIQYQNTLRKVDLDFNENIVRRDNSRSIHKKPDYEEDPEYLEFLKFKKMKSKSLEMKDKKLSADDQFNELLLYIFTGFFLLMIYDNIYKLGRDSFY